MALSTTTARVSYSGDGSTTSFAFPCKYIAAADFEVALQLKADTTTEIAQTRNTDYTISATGTATNGVYPGASVVFTTAPSALYNVVIFRNPALTQEFDFDAEGDPLPVLTRYADYTEMKLQALACDIADLDAGTVTAEAPSREFYAEDYGAAGDGATDDTAAVQACFNAAAANYGIARLLAKTYIVSALSIPAGLMLKGDGDNYGLGSRLKLKASSNTFIAATAGYVSNSAAVTYGGFIDNVIFDGNSANNSGTAITTALLTLRTYRQHVINCTFYDAKGRGVLLTPLSANATVISNGMAENHIFNCNFDTCQAEGFYGEDGGNTKLADFDIESCNFNGCGGGSTKKISCYIERGAGVKVLDNQFYGAGKGELYIAGAGRTVIANNHFDISSNGQTSGTVNNVEISCAGTGGHAHVVVGNNLFHMNAASAGSVTWQHLAVTGGGANTRVIAAGNTFYSHSFAMAAHVWSGTGTIRAPDNVYYQTWPQASSSPNEVSYYDNGAGEGPIHRITRLSDSPAANDALGALGFYGQDSGAADQEYALIRAIINSPTATSESGGLELYCMRSGSRTLIAKLTDAFRVGASATDTGANTLNVQGGIYQNAALAIDAAGGHRLPVYTAANIADKTHAVNTANKGQGKCVYDSTNHRVMVADGSSDVSNWYVADASASVTPA